jgi:hypothetical protein
LRIAAISSLLMCVECMCVRVRQFNNGNPVVLWSQEDGVTKLTFVRPLTAPGLIPISTTGFTDVIYGFGSGNGFQKHPDGNRRVRHHPYAALIRTPGCRVRVCSLAALLLLEAQALLDRCRGV